MPELPEVEIVVRTLRKLIINHKILKIIFFREKLLKNGNCENFCKLLKGEVITKIIRIGKNIIIYLNKFVLLFHLRMEGKFFFNLKELQTNNNHYMVSFEFTNKTVLNYHDTRRFGTLFWYKISSFSNIKTLSPLSRLGYEPWDKLLDAKYFKNKIKNHKIPIKSILLDQSIISGIGNIYANEILFLSSINPNKKANLITKNEINKILDNSKIILKKAIKHGGTTIATFSHGNGISGKFQNELLVHGRVGLLCKKCMKSKIKKIKINQRGTYFCHSCQK